MSATSDLHIEHFLKSCQKSLENCDYFLANAILHIHKKLIGEVSEVAFILKTDILIKKVKENRYIKI